MGQFIRFILVGGAAAAVNIIARYILDIWFSFQTAIIASYLIAMMVAFILNRIFVFNGEKRFAGEFIRFALVNFVALFVVWATSMLFSRWIFPGVGMTYYPNDIAHIIGVCVPAITSYFGHKYFTFKGAK